MTRKSFRKLSFILTAVVLSGVLYLSTTYATLAPLTPPPSGGYDSGSNSILDPGCGPTNTDCFVKEFQGWSLTGNSGTTAGANFIGTTDAQDFMIKTNNAQIALFGADGTIALGAANAGFGTLIPTATGDAAIAIGTGANATNTASVALGGGSTSSGESSLAIGAASSATNIGSVAIGIDSVSSGEFSTALGIGAIASGNYSFAYLGEASGLGAIAFGGTASGIGSLTFGGEASGIGATAFGGVASGQYSFNFGNGTNEANGDWSYAFGNTNIATGDFSYVLGQLSESVGNSSFAIGREIISYAEDEIVIGVRNTAYTPATGFAAGTNRLFTIGNGGLGNGVAANNNAYTLFRDGSFAYNDDNFQNDDPGTEQNMFYFNYGNHDGLGSAQTKRAIRLGSATNDEWDINNANVGDRSIAIGFGSATASGDGSVALLNGIAAGNNSMAFGLKADTGSTAPNSLAIGFSNAGTSANAEYSIAMLGGTTSGRNSVAIGALSQSFSGYEYVIGRSNTTYVPVSSSGFNVADRLFVIGNGDGFQSDAFTILKNGKTSIGYDNFETTTLDSLLQVNGSILSADLAGCDSLSSDSDGKILCSGVTNGLGMISGSIGLGGTLTQNTTINQDIYNHTLLQPVSTTGALVMTQGLTTVTGLPGNVMGYIATNGDSARTISWASGASNKDLHTLSGSGDPDLLSGGSEIRTDYDITDTSSAMASLYAFDTPNGKTSRLQVTPTYLNIILDPTGELRINNSAGTSGYVLASNGAGAAPTWQDPNLLISDERLKSNVSDLPSDTLSKLAQVRTVMYTLNTDQTNRMQVGFLAQDLEQYFPELVGQKDSTYKGVYYAQMTPVLVQAIRELNLNITDIANTAVSNTWRDALIAWFGNVENGISELFADRIRAKNEICIDDVCMTKDQLQVILNNNQIVPSPSPAPVPTIDDDTASSGNDDQISPVDNPADDGTDIGSSDPVVTPPADTPTPNDTPAPTE